MRLVEIGELPERTAAMRARLREAGVKLELSAGGEGFGVLIAHPERSPSTPVAHLHKQVAHGAFIQINPSSVFGLHGQKPERVDTRKVRAAADALPAGLLIDGLAAANPRFRAHPGTYERRSGLGRRERAGGTVSRSSQVFLDCRRGT